jgi:hypothetical protein
MASKDKRPASLARRALFTLILVVLVLGTLEGVAWVGLYSVYGETVSASRIQDERLAVREGAGEEIDGFHQPENKSQEKIQIREAIHPYLGYVADPERDPMAKEKRRSKQAIDFGFAGNVEDLFLPDDPDSVVVVIVGGSVAHTFADVGRGALMKRLEDSDRFGGKSIHIVSLANPGYKQPQQLFALNYFLSLGMRMDVVINLDGFNEIALPPTENVVTGVFPFYPRSWNIRVDRLDADARLLQAELTLLERQRLTRARAFSGAVASRSMSANLLWKLWDLRSEHASQRMQAELLEHQKNAKSSYQARGPARAYRNEAALYADLVAQWKRSTRLMHAVCAALGIEYFHFLQPNQYVPDSKPMGDFERRLAIYPEHPYREPVLLGYPLLLEAGAELQAEGIPFFDLTRIFVTDKKPAYQDQCCHLNRRGNAAMAFRISDQINAGPKPLPDLVVPSASKE